MAFHRIGVVMVHTLQLYGNAVDQKLTLRRNCDCAEAYGNRDKLAKALQHQGVEVRNLCAPGFCIGYGKVCLSVDDRLFLDAGIAVIEAGGEISGRSGHFHGKLGEVCVDLHILHMLCGTGQHIDVTEDSCHTEEILILHVAAVAPFEDFHDDLVFALVKVRGHVKLSGAVAALAVADLLTVDNKIKTGVYALEYQVSLFREVRTVKPGAVNTAGVLVRHIGRIYGIGIVYVGVVGRLEAFHLPV